MDADVVWAHAEHPSDLRLRRLRVLRRGPHLAAIAADVCHRDGWLHRHVRQVRHVVLGLDDSRRALQRRLRVTHLACDRPGHRDRLGKGLAVLGRVVTAVRTVTPT